MLTIHHTRQVVVFNRPRCRWDGHKERKREGGGEEGRRREGEGSGRDFGRGEGGKWDALQRPCYGTVVGGTAGYHDTYLKDGLLEDSKAKTQA
jgi:hypothetical protein